MHPPKPPVGAAHAAGLAKLRLQRCVMTSRRSSLAFFSLAKNLQFFRMRFGTHFLRILDGFCSRKPPKMVPKLVRKQILERTRCWVTFLHDFYMFFALFSINFLHAFLQGLLAFFPDFLHFLKTAEVHFGATLSSILRFGRVSTRERFSKRFAKIREKHHDFYLQNS